MAISLIPSRKEEIDFITHAYAQVEEVNFELEQYKQQNRDLANQLAKCAEDQELLEAQLYETGNAADEANAEVGALLVASGWILYMTIIHRFWDGKGT